MCVGGLCGSPSRCSVEVAVLYVPNGLVSSSSAYSTRTSQKRRLYTTRISFGVLSLGASRPDKDSTRVTRSERSACVRMSLLKALNDLQKLHALLKSCNTCTGPMNRIRATREETPPFGNPVRKYNCAQQLQGNQCSTPHLGMAYSAATVAPSIANQQYGHIYIYIY